MPKIEKGTAHTAYDYWTVLINLNELITDSGKPYPLSTWIGTFQRDGTINVWTPCGYKPRGYRAAAERMLRETADAFLKSLPRACDEMSDGRGHALADYDGAEHEQQIDGVWYFIYRVN